jgi:Xaa-Pro aminopeptidase
MAMIKTHEELKLLREAALLGTAVYREIIPEIAAGVSEHAIAARMEQIALSYDGVTGLSFPTIVASGPNGALPHAVPTDRDIEAGDFVTIDFGLMYKGYASDETRTFAVGKPAAQLLEIYEVVRESQQAGVDVAKAGMIGSELDKVCRDIIVRAGYGDYFIHTTGHGIGTEVHEDPRVGKDSHAVVLQENMAVTIEPGIYIEGLGGVRIEDTVLITKNGCEVITAGIPKTLITL